MVQARKSLGRGILAVVTLAAVPQGAWANISGVVRNGDTNDPIAGAQVRLEADPTGPVVTTAGDGSFNLPVNPAGTVTVTASVTYNHAAAVNYAIGGTSATNGQANVEIFLAPIGPPDAAYEPQLVADTCLACHSSHVDEWSQSVHAGAGQDAWVLDLFSGTGTPGGGAGYVFRDTHNPGDTGTCATCHTPMADVFNPGNIMLDEVTQPAALEGVSCVGCHQIDDVNNNINSIHLLGNATYRFPSGFVTERFVWGPLPDVSFPGMRSSYAPIYSDSRYCASCHQYAAPFGQTTYTEWLASPFAEPGPTFRSCQDCHMPGRTEPSAICDEPFQPIRPAGQRTDHRFVGSTPETLTAGIDLDTLASVVGDRVRVTATVTNHGAGHSFPTGISIRNAFVVIEASIDGVPLAQVAGPTIPFWASDDVPGDQPGDYAGRPGAGFAKINQGRINGMGPQVAPVLFVDAESVIEHSSISSGESRVTEVEFELPAILAGAGDVIDVEARLIYRRAFRALAVTKGWTQTPQGGPIEIEVAADRLEVRGQNVLEVPALDLRGLALLALVLAGAGWVVLRRR